MSTVLIKRGTKSSYNSLTTKDGNTLYFILDTGEIFLGGTKMSVTDLSGYVVKENGKGLSTNDLTDALLQKINSWEDTNTTYTLEKSGSNIILKDGDGKTVSTITDSNTIYTHPSYTAKSSGLYKVTVDDTGHVSATAAVAKSDITGLGIPAQDTTYSVATISADGLMSKSDKAKLDAIDDEANKYTHPSYSAKTNGLYKVTVDATGHVSGVTSVTKSDITALGIPAQDTNTTYDEATTTTSGLMSAEDKAKLDGVASGANKYSLPTASSSTLGGVKVGSGLTISSGVLSANAQSWDTITGKPSTFTPATHSHNLGEVSDTSSYVRMTPAERTKLSGIATGAEVNQNAFAKVTVGTTTIEADAKQDTITLAAGSNVTITPDATNDKITISATDTVYTHPAYTDKSSGLYKVTVDATGHVSAATAVTKADITALGIPGSDTNTTYSAGSGLTLDGTKFNINTEYTTSGKNYKVQVDSTTGGLYVNVPWTDSNTTYTGANGVSISGTIISNSGVRSISTGSTNGTISVNTNGTSANVAVKGLGSAAYTESSAYATSGHGHTALTTLVGSDTNKSARTIAAEEVAKVVASAPEDFDTLKEMSDWISGHEDDATAMNSAITTAQSDINSHKSASNPHGITKSIIGLGNVENKSSATIRGELTKANVTTALGYTPPTTNTTYNRATYSSLGLIKPWYSSTGVSTYEGSSSSGQDAPSINDRTTTTGRYYLVEVDANGRAYVNVPWTDRDTVYTHPSYTAKTSGLYKVTVDATGHVSAAIAVTKSDITALGIPGSDTNTNYYHSPSYSSGLKISIGTGVDNMYVPTANANTLGVVKGWHRTSGVATGTQTTNATNTPAIAARSTTSGRYYGVETDGAGSMFVNVPWTDTKYTHPSYTAKSSGLYKITVDSAGHVSAATAVTKSDITALGIPGSDTNTTYSKATNTYLGLIKPWYSTTGASTYNGSSTAPTAGSDAPSINTRSTTSSRYYLVEMDTNGRAYVNVPWTDTDTKYTHPSYTAKSSGLYKVTVDATGHVSAATAVTKSDITALGIPGSDTNTTYSIATASTAGLVKPISVITKPTINNVTSTAGRYYQVQMSSDGNMFVNVPWSDSYEGHSAVYDSGLIIGEGDEGDGWDDLVVPYATASQYGVVKSAAVRTSAITTTTGGTTSGRYYGVELDSNGKMFVNVPWTDTNTTYTHPTTAGNKHIPSGGSSGQTLIYSSSGTAVWGQYDPEWGSF